MALPIYIIRPAARCLRRTRRHDISILFSYRTLTTTTPRHEEATIESTAPSPPPPPPPSLDPNTIHTRKEEHLLAAHGRYPIGSRRRRAALASTSNIPFEQLPYQCFQEARKILAADREVKLKQIEEERRRIAKVEATDVSKLGGEVSKKGKLVAMHKYLEQLKVLADSNDPVIKKRFEDGYGMFRLSFLSPSLWRLLFLLLSNVRCCLELTSFAITGDMNRPIYRHLANKQWHSYRRKIQEQRITQMHIVPDILPHMNMVAEVTLAFGRHNIQPGAFVESRISEKPARLHVQVFDKGTRLVSIVVVDPDVPNTETDGFEYRCHFLAVNIPISPTRTSLPLATLTNQPSQLVLPWLPPYAQKGSPYHRLAVFVLQHQDGKELDVEAVKKKVKRDGFKLRSFMDRYRVLPVGVALFRSIWDEGTAGVMQRAGIEGANMEMVRKKSERLPFRKKDGIRYRGYRHT